MSIAGSTFDATLAAAEPARGSLLSRYAVLTKARLSALVLLTTIVGFVMADAGAGWLTLVWTTLGTALAAGSAAALNQYFEVSRDALMHRTQQRPLVAGTLSKAHGFLAGIVMAMLGVGILALGTNLLAAGLALLTILLYVGIYTPMKARSSLNTLVGAVVGAIPPMIGWSAATGTLSEGAWLLGAILFFWQIPHFLALAWMYREDYHRGGFVMLPGIDHSGELTCRVIVLTSMMMIPIGLAVVLAGVAGWLYAAGSVLLGGMLVVLAGRMYLNRARHTARSVFLASIIYLPVLLGLLVADRGPIPGATSGSTTTVAMIDAAD